MVIQGYEAVTHARDDDTNLKVGKGVNDRRPKNSRTTASDLPNAKQMQEQRLLRRAGLSRVLGKREVKRVVAAGLHAESAAC